MNIFLKAEYFGKSESGRDLHKSLNFFWKLGKSFPKSSHACCRPSFDSFNISIFLFFIVLGGTTGLFIGALYHLRWLGISVGLIGLIAGYGVGILAGLWVQYLGWMAGLFNHLALAAIVGMIVVNLVIPSSLFF